jgi:hypothetical protein
MRFSPERSAMVRDDVSHPLPAGSESCAFFRPLTYSEIVWVLPLVFA